MELVRSIAVTGSIADLTPNGGHRNERDTFHVTFDPETEPIASVVTESVAAIQNTELEELDPLYDAVDPESIDALLAANDDEQSGADVVEFVYEGMEVTIGSDGDVWLKWR